MPRAVTAPTLDELRGAGTVSVPQAAAFLGISGDLAYELIAARKFPHLKLGRRLRVPAAELLDLVGRPVATDPKEAA